MKKLRFSVLMNVMLVAFMILGFSGYSVKEKNSNPYVDSKPRLAIESAFAPELRLLLDNTTNKKEYVINGITYTTGRLRGVPVVLSLSGVSMVNAAANTQLLLDNFNVTHLVFSGIAGGVNPNLNIGDVVVPARWKEYQEMRFVRQFADGSYDLPEDMDYTNFGMMVSQTVEVFYEGGVPDEAVEVDWFYVDETLLSYAEGISSDVLERCTSDDIPVCLTEQPLIHVGGNGVDGPTFVDNAEFRNWAWENFEADSLSMETAAVAHVCFSNQVPFLGFRSLSDLAGGGEGANEIYTFFGLASNNSANVVMEFVENFKAGEKVK